MHLNPKLEHLEESVTLQLNTAVAALQKKGVHVLNLTAGELDFETPSPIRKSVAHLLKYNRYTATAGLPELRTAIAASKRRAHHIRCAPEKIVVTAGAKQALAEVMQAILAPGDEVLIPTPTWVSYEHQVRLAGGRPVFVPLNQETFDINVTAIKNKLTSRTKAIILNSPHNPTGAVFSKTNLQKLEQLFRNKNIFIVIDDIYHSLAYTKDAISPATIFAKHKHLILIDGFSKSHALTGWRIGYCVAPRAIIHALTAYQSHTSGNASLPSQYAALACLKAPAIPKQFNQAMRKRRDLVHALLTTIPNITWVKPEGAFYFLLNIKAIEKDSMRFCERLLTHAHVALVPGEAFHAQGFVRLSFTASEATLRAALQCLKKFIQTYA